LIKRRSRIKLREKRNSVEPVYYDIGLCGSPPITSD
jgi:hypothetical protein